MLELWYLARRETKKREGRGWNAREKRQSE
jgi:hypothetical protein